MLVRMLRTPVGVLYKNMGLLAAKTFILSVMERFVNFEELKMETNSKDALMRQTQSWGVTHLLGRLSGFVAPFPVQGQTDSTVQRTAGRPSIWPTRHPPVTCGEEW